jgi:hypothetical protein
MKLGTLYNHSGGLGNQLLKFISIKRFKNTNPYLYSSKIPLITGEKFLPVFFSRWKPPLLEALIGLSYSDLDNYLLLPNAANEGLYIHFRGSDFAQWKSHSVMKMDWYEEVLSRAEFQNIDCVYLMSDDYNHTTVCKLKSYFNQKGIKVISFQYRSHILSDWWCLYNSKYIIASPSTFSITAGIFGKSIIYLSREYAKSESSNINNIWNHLLNKPTRNTVLKNIKLI